jgi:hypothetical protein
MNFFGSPVGGVTNTKGWSPFLQQFLKQVEQGGGWQINNDTLWGAQGTVSMPSNTGYTFNGTLWTRGNAANDRVTMATVPGQGLAISPAISVLFEPPTYTAPYLSVPLSSVIPNFGLTTRFRCTWWRYSGNESTTSLGADISSMGVYNPTTNTYHKIGHEFDSNQGAASCYTESTIGTQSGQINQNLSLSSYNVFRVEFPMGIGANYAIYSVATYGSDWPTDGEFVSAYNALPTGALNFNASYAVIGTAAGYNLALSAERKGGSPTNLTVTFGRTRIESDS